MGNTLFCFRRECDSFILFNLLPEMPNHQTYACNLPAKTSAHVAARQVQIKADTFPA
jgi:hypothetical protein